jgi:hypothetical protein
LIRAWWDVDRVRISPREGQLLRLQSGSVIRICGEPFEVVERLEDGVSEESAGERESSVYYLCRGGCVSGRLQVRLAGSGELRAVWTVGMRVCALDVDQVEVFG